MHGSDKTGLGFGHVQKKVRNDPGNGVSLQLKLQRDMMTAFRKQKGGRDAENLEDSE